VKLLKIKPLRWPRAVSVDTHCGLPFAELGAAIDDARRAWTSAVRAEQAGNHGRANLDLMQVEDAIDRMYTHIFQEWGSRYGCDDEVES